MSHELVVGLTGGIGSGKSSVARLRSRARRRPVVDADAIAHELTAGRRGHPRRSARRSARSVSPSDGALDRERLRAARLRGPGFARAPRGDPAPADPRREPPAATAAAALRRAGGAAALERGDPRRVSTACSSSIAPRRSRSRRVMRRSGLAAEPVRAIMATQLPRAARLAQADDVIDNGGDPRRDPAAVSVAASLPRYRGA